MFVYIYFFIFMTECYAPTFERARTTLAHMFNGWIFGSLRRPVVHPDPNKPYFHGMIVTTCKKRLWFQQTTRAREPVFFGPVRVDATRAIPAVDDVIMGQVLTGKDGKQRLVKWYITVNALQHLSHLSTAGTNKHEMQLLHDLRTSANDDIWALCRLVLFGNIEIFVDAHVHQKL